MHRKKIYPCVDIVKFIFAIMIVMMHADLLGDTVLGHKFQIVLFALIVPYFFIAAGFFIGKKMRASNSFVEERNVVFRSFKRYSKLYFIFGGWYFTCDFLKIMLLESNKRNSILHLVHRLFVETPGGGIWFIYTLMWAMIVLYYFRKKQNSFLTCISLFLTLYVIGSAFFLNGFKEYGLRRIYDKVLLSDHNLLFFGIYIFGGIELGYTSFKRQMTKSMMIVYACLLILYCIYGFRYCNIDTPIGGFTLNILKCITCFILFGISINIQIRTINTSYYRKLSTIIYFTHWNFVNLILLIRKIVPINRTFSAFLCTILSILFSIVISKYKNGKVYDLLFK